MDNERRQLAEQLEIIGEMLEVEGVEPLLEKFKPGMNVLHINAIALQICAVVLGKRKEVADRLVAMHKNCSVEEIAGMDDAEYSLALKNAILGDALGFFGSSQRTAGKK